MTTKSVPYPKEGQTITFLEPFPRKQYDWGAKVCYYILVDVRHNGTLYHGQIRIKAKSQIRTMDLMIANDKKLTQSVVKCMPDKSFMVLSLSPQTDFFDQIPVNITTEISSPELKNHMDKLLSTWKLELCYFE